MELGTRLAAIGSRFYPQRLNAYALLKTCHQNQSLEKKQVEKKLGVLETANPNALTCLDVFLIRMRILMGKSHHNFDVKAHHDQGYGFESISGGRFLSLVGNR
ncbi:hypothetical protein TWF506_005985 [Arthrobotrys conoides]|uniref:Uncharacterized protein n=1 Tax=Arthrobotrys conoides TaxID=74498 RepID=A0AAN8NSJ0_9PEZI